MKTNKRSTNSWREEGRKGGFLRIENTNNITFKRSTLFNSIQLSHRWLYYSANYYYKTKKSEQNTRPNSKPLAYYGQEGTVKINGYAIIRAIPSAKKANVPTMTPTLNSRQVILPPRFEYFGKTCFYCACQCLTLPPAYIHTQVRSQVF